MRNLEEFNEDKYFVDIREDEDKMERLRKIRRLALRRVENLQRESSHALSYNELRKDYFYRKLDNERMKLVGKGEFSDFIPGIGFPDSYNPI